MAKARKDLRGRALKTGEIQRKDDLRYMYSYTDPLGRRKFIYANDLTELREKERKLQRDQLDGLDIYAQGKATINDTFDRYISTKYELRDSTKDGYLYFYDHFVRDNFGMKKLIEVKYSDVLQYYHYLMNELNVSISSVETIHGLLHPTFNLAVRDDIIRKNPTDGVMAEISKKCNKEVGVRHALTRDQQRVFMDYMAKHPVYYHWWPLFTVLLGTGCRIGECLGLRWDDLDFEKRIISVNHSIVYRYSTQKKDTMISVSLPKTKAGIRTIPMLDIVKDAFDIEKEEQAVTGGNTQVIDGMRGFIFCNRFKKVHNPQSVNDTIRRICKNYNAEEVLNAKKEGREPIILPDFSCHHLRHTFCTRLCETETNLKVIQDIMGHRDIKTTMNIYAEATQEMKQKSFENLAAKLDDIF
ncbi:site-specific integrase [Oribacterium sp. C9]|uniref:tyrosine-type recombinase/integrase n=1 Tax=Oribacterium sp. C9 TaxID=1943579 RepID=UPI00098F22DC|nr:tyrosine-type recombinase/integrase [Oribacterium sp. C9]OON87476.1 site-specific integrase [Oribacterium sp. C9]